MTSANRPDRHVGIWRRRCPSRRADGATVVFKYAKRPFQHEPAILAHAVNQDLQVPELIASIEWADALGMLPEDLGASTREATTADAVPVAVAIDAATPMPDLPVQRSPSYPKPALAALTTLHERGRWADTDVREGLASMQALASQRTEGAELAPFGLCHSEFHPTSIHIGPAGVRVLDFARAFTGPGLLDLASWTDTANPPDFTGLRELPAASVAVAGAAEALADRAGLPAERWGLRHAPPLDHRLVSATTNHLDQTAPSLMTGLGTRPNSILG